MTLTANTQAPNFRLEDENGDVRELQDYKGSPVLLYFYPKDDTPGCTTEACNFRDDYSTYEKAGVRIIGVSPDTVKAHKKFKEKYHLPFTLLADVEHTVCQLYGVWGRKKFMGKEYDGVFRTTFLIDNEGMIKKVYENVKPADHSKQIIDDLG
ncbi:thioredoxin-dependent thiol peroxidase [Leptolinea tardivitalis]|uniref:thioredoxin-dependent peroxiredoxin n=1 Tax=Leptolinea tardivitalis TaxID=229920 RepID=A0A0N8GMA8_9CHLR|nr:thioredoxin-dependent thiol peroxidase [Leptolinea tardivitalis]KPL74778.1 peroxiredoxin [Leptolinea tardivitalis]GAP22848.1 peroxiredoxin [Leptolinea tardivitalis]